MSAFTTIPNRTFPMKRPAALLLLLLFASSLHTQNLSSEPQPDQQLLNEWAEALAAEMEEGAEDAQHILMEQLLQLYQNPININTATREELQKIFFLSDLQIEALLFQRFQNKAFYSIYEMQDRKSTRLNSSHVRISYAVFCLKKKKSNKLSYNAPH